MADLIAAQLEFHKKAYEILSELAPVVDGLQVEQEVCHSALQFGYAQPILIDIRLATVRAVRVLRLRLVVLFFPYSFCLVNHIVINATVSATDLYPYILSANSDC